MEKPINLQYTIITSPVPDFIYQGLAKYSRAANGYHSQPKELKEKLAQKFGIPEEMLLLTAGADEAIRMFALAYGKATYVFTPTFISYADIQEFYAQVTYVNALTDNQYVIETSKKKDASLIYVVNPNNPFGFTTKEKLRELVKNNPQAIVVIDEVYAEFANLSVLEYVEQYPNLAVIRSFSKAYALAGNRIGFVVAQKPIIEQLRRKTPWANVSYLSVGAAMLALDHEAYFTKLREEIILKRKEFSTFLADHSFMSLPSEINCVLLKFPTEEQGTRFVAYLKENNIIVSHGNGHSNIGLDKSFVRMAIGTEDEMKYVKEVLKSFITKRV